MRSSPIVEDVPELMHHIQSRLPIKEAACTSILSKSWLHAWSTIPTLRFCVYERKHFEVVERTLERYFCDNIPIERFDLYIDIKNVESASLAEKWIRSVATKSCCSLKQLSISVRPTGASLTLPDEILSVAKNLTNLRVRSLLCHWRGLYAVRMKTPVIINCVSLREIQFKAVHMSQEVLDGMLSTCNLLKNIELHFLEQDEGRGRISIKIKDLAHLEKINIYSEDGASTDLEISGVPNLRLFRCDLNCGLFGRPNQNLRPFSAYPISLGTSVTELWLGGFITGESSLQMIKSGFPFLESLSLEMSGWILEIFHFTCASLKTLSLMWEYPRRITDVKVHAPKLLEFRLVGHALPSLSFPVSTTLVHTTFKLTLGLDFDVSFFLRMREALALSSKCDVSITTIRNLILIPDIDLDDLRARLPLPPANNVQMLEFQANGVEEEGRSLFFNGFFEICHPKLVSAKPDITPGPTTNHFFDLMLFLQKKKKMMMKTSTTSPYWPRYLKHVQIRRQRKWETLRNSHKTLLGGWPIHFKLNWRL